MHRTERIFQSNADLSKAIRAILYKNKAVWKDFGPQSIEGLTLGIINKYHHNPYEIITVLSNGANFALDSRIALNKYEKAIRDFISLANQSNSSADLLGKIRVSLNA